MTRFTIAGLMRTIPENTPVKYENVQKFVRRLVKFEYVAKDGGYSGGRAGDKQQYRLTNNIGPIMPVLGIGRAVNQLTNNCEKVVSDTQKETETQGGPS
ncbi:MAG: hypothetical protein HIU83_16530 [Proteobacteria bacterium]|nr:hypothetical protein [Pseudomonadota bacterium]